MLIGVDLDDTLADTMSALINFHNDCYGTSLCKNKIVDLDYLALWQCSKEETYTRFHRFFSTPYYENSVPQEGSREIIKKLVKANELVIITGRAVDVIAEQTFFWLKKHFPGRFSNVYFVNDYAKDRDYKRIKTDICRRLGVDLLIDDSHECVLDCAKNGIPAILFNQPWNQGYLPPAVPRTSSWSEIPDLL
ncbi:MAG: hypothetical protein AAB360_02995 [Patescibacteria group bacterium]